MVTQGVCLEIKTQPGHDWPFVLYSPPRLSSSPAHHVSTTARGYPPYANHSSARQYHHVASKNDVLLHTFGPPSTFSLARAVACTTHLTRLALSPTLPLQPLQLPPPPPSPPQTVDRALASPAQGPSTDTTRENVTRHDANANGLQEHTAFFCRDFFSAES